MLKYSDIKEVLDEHTLRELIINYSNRQRINKEKNEEVASEVVDGLAFDSDIIPGSYTTKFGILLSALLNSGTVNGLDIARRILNLYRYNKSQEVIVATQYIDLLNTKDIDPILFSYIMNGLIAIANATEIPGYGFKLDTDYGSINVTKANEVLDIDEINADNRRQLCHQVTSNALLDYPNMYGAYYYIPQAFDGCLEHSVLINPDSNKVIDLANNSAIDLEVWQKLYHNPAFTIKGQEFAELYKRFLDDYNEGLHLAALEEVRRIRKK